MAHAWVQHLSGRFLVFDGPDGCGKTTQFRRMSNFLRSCGLEVCEVREPGGTIISEKIRDILLEPEHKEMNVRCEMLLYMASRAQLVAQRIIPALARGDVVIADRFISSTLAYQGTAGGMAEKDILEVGRIAIGGRWPDVMIFFDVDELTASKRLNPLLDRMELKGSDYHRRVRAGYLDQARRQPDRHIVIDASQSIQAVFDNVCAALRQRFAEDDIVTN